MKQNTKIQAFFDAKRIVSQPNPRTELIDRVNLQRAKLSVPHNNLALCLLDISKKLSDIHDYNQRRKTRLEQLKQSVLFTSENPWETDVYTILEVLFSKEAAPHIAKAWHKLEGGMYQTGYKRRSFRAPHNKAFYFEKKVNWLKHLWQAWKYDLTLSEIAQYSTSFHLDVSLTLNEIVGYGKNFQLDVSWVLAAAIDNNHPKMLNTLLSILQGESEVGSVSRTTIKALLLSEKPEAWEAVKQLLLAAQRQEGLRQTILESLDETSLGAMKFMLKVILEEDLLRFSSVVRALDVWTGMGWESERKSAIKSALEFGYTYLISPEKIPEGIASKNNVELYMALWAQGVLDVERCVPLLEKLVTKANLEKRAIALYFTAEAQLQVQNSLLKERLLDSEHLWDIYWSCRFYQEDDFDKASEYYKKWHEKAPKKATLLPNKGFEWLKFSFSKEIIEQKWVADASNNESKQQKLLPFIKEFSIAARERYTGNILGDFVSYKYRKNKEKSLSLSTFQQDVALQMISDRSASIQTMSINALNHAELNVEELPLFLSLLKKKSANLRKSVIQLLETNLEDNLLLETIQTLINEKAKEPRIAALDLIKQMVDNNRSASEAKAIAKTYKNAGHTSPDELLILEDVLAEKTDYSKENGWGLYNPAELPPVELPKVDENHFFHQRIKSNTEEKPSRLGKLTTIGRKNDSEGKSGYSMPIEKIKAQLHLLNDLVAKHKDYEYEVETFTGAKEYRLLGNWLTHPLYYEKSKNLSDEEWYNTFPLNDLWKKWYEESGLDAYDLFYLNHSSHSRINYDYFPDWFNALRQKYFHGIPIKNDYYEKSNFPFGDQMSQILYALFRLDTPENSSSYRLEASISICNDYVEKYKASPLIDNSNNEWLFTNFPYFRLYFNHILHKDLNDDELRRMYQLEQWMEKFSEDRNQGYSLKAIMNLGEYHKRLSLPEAAIYKYMLTPEMLRALTEQRNGRKEQDWRTAYPELAKTTYSQTITNRLLDIEFTRGESDTEVTHLVKSIQKIYGLDKLVKCLQALGKQSLKSGYSYYYSTPSKKEIMSMLLRNCYPLESDNQAAFDDAVKSAKFTEKRLAETAMYAPQWRKFVQNHLQWDGLDSAIWWLHAHSSTYLSAEKETEIGRYSAIAIEEFNKGAVDVDWFKEMYEVLGKAKWKIIYDAAKYISYGNGHTLAKLYADVILKNVKITEVTKRVKDKRNQNYLRVYGLVPLSKTVPQKDVLKRYNYLQQFLKESKQFGSQRQASEAEAVAIALDNLARNAGYPDPIRLRWAMEGLHAKQLLENAQTLTFDKVKLRLEVSETGKASIKVEKAGKPLKSIPAKLRKDKKVLELKDFQKQLKEQYSRTRKSLEQAMVNQDAFLTSEIQGLINHPVVNPMISSLVLRTEHHQGMWQNGALVDVDGSTHQPSEDELIYIAHCTHLHDAGKWTDWQHYCFKNQVKQTFKQIYRELYLPTADEQNNQTLSKRYAGHQVQPKKTVALLKSRGWTVDYVQGLQKVLHKQNVVVELYALADWFSPADVESPTLETIRFYHRKTYKTIPFSELPNYVFSEVMRDIDLVVSVAHVGGVDPEASLSTIELRKVIAEESARLFKLENVNFKERHLIIDGHHANYSLHLGSGVVHVQPGGYVSIVPVHSQHRGRLFLPFVDDDPKTAEIVSKMLLLAEDEKLQDPTILEQLLGR